MKLYAKRMSDGSVDLYDINGDVMIQIHTASEEAVKPRTDDDIAEEIRAMGWNVEWLEGGK